jgi:predicted phage terminase large subunit-like protein
MEIKPQPVQEVALTCTSKIVLIGGAKGGGKSFALRLAPLYNIDKKGYHAVIFRRTLAQCKKPGGLWDKSYDIYPYLGGVERVSELKWLFSSGATIQFSHLQRDISYRDWFGTETAFYGFDQLEEFTREQFFNILGCMRTTANCETQIMASMNPDNNSWVRELVDPWIADDGYVDLEKNCKEFYFVIEDGLIKWVDKSVQNAIAITYISADIWDNPALLESDPNYLINLQSQAKVDRERFLGIKGRGGNWNVKPVAGKIFKYAWFRVIDSVDSVKFEKVCRFWDFAMSLRETKDDDYIVGGLMARFKDEYLVLDVYRTRLPPADVDKLVLKIAAADAAKYRNYFIRWQQDPGSAGVKETYFLRQKLLAYDANGIFTNESKIDRVKPFSRAVEVGLVSFKSGQWNNQTFAELENFPDAKHDDIVDYLSGGFRFLSSDSNFSLGKYSF